MKETKTGALAVAAVGAAAGTIVGAKLCRFYRDLAPDTGEDERLFAETEDGWRIAIYRYAARGDRKPIPVVAGHGFAGSRLIWDLTPETSLARYLAGAGYDFYAIDLRGRGESWPVDGSGADAQWSFDDFVFRDLPTSVATACECSGVDEAFWLGLEMSGQALYAAAVSGTAQQVRAGVTFGAPVLTPASAEVPGVTTKPRMRRNGRLQFRAGAHHAGPILALLHSKQLESSFRPENFDPIGPARYLRHGVPDEATRLADQFADWIEHATMRSLDHSTVWSEHLDQVTLPLLIMAGAHDLQRPADATRRAFEAFGSFDKSFIEAGEDTGFSLDFGHDDLIAGRASSSEIFPKIRVWLDDHVHHARDGQTTKLGVHNDE
ncbi:MAG: alpha/beta fold hydrolase [Acidimicrobiales bacterium]